MLSNSKCVINRKRSSMENLKTPNNIYFRNVGVQTFRHINVFSDVITFEIGQSARETCFQFTFGGFAKSVLKKMRLTSVTFKSENEETASVLSFSKFRILKVIWNVYCTIDSSRLLHWYCNDVCFRLTVTMLELIVMFFLGVL